MLHVARDAALKGADFEIAEQAVGLFTLVRLGKISFDDLRNVRIFVPQGDDPVGSDDPDAPDARAIPEIEAPVNPSTRAGFAGWAACHRRTGQKKESHEQHALVIAPARSRLNAHCPKRLRVRARTRSNPGGSVGTIGVRADFC